MFKVKTSQSLPAGRQGAISILLTILILSIVLVIAFGISAVMLRQIKMSGQSSDSVRAYQAADSGIEYGLYQIIQNGADELGDFSGLCSGGSWIAVGAGSYCLEPTEGTGQIDSLKSIGRAGLTRRAVEIRTASP